MSNTNLLSNFDYIIVADILVICALLVISAVLSCAETAITRTSRSRIRYLAKEGHHRNAGTIYNLLHHRSRLISTILIGNNIANIFASSIATALLIGLIGGKGFIVASVFMSAIIIIFTEITPKQYALRYPEKISLHIAPVIKLIVFLLHPILFCVEKISDMVITLLPAKSAPSDDEDIETEIKGAIDLYQSRGYFSEQQADIMDNIFAIHKVTVTSVMIPLSKTIMIDINQAGQDTIEYMLHHTYDNFPVYENDRSNIVGIVSLRDIFRLHVQHKIIDRKQLITLIRQVKFVPNNTTLLKQIDWFKKNKQQMAIIINENKQSIGIITLQDIVKDVLYQNPPQEKANYQNNNHITTQDDGSIIADGNTKISEINLIYSTQLPEKTLTIAGFIMQLQQSQQNSDKKFVYGDLHISVIKSTGRKIQKVKIKPLYKS